MWNELPGCVELFDVVLIAVFFASAAGIACYWFGYSHGFDHCERINGEPALMRAERAEAQLGDALDDADAYLALRECRHRKFELAALHPWNEVGQDNLALDVRGGGL